MRRGSGHCHPGGSVGLPCKLLRDGEWRPSSLSATRDFGIDPLNPDPEDVVDEERFSYEYDAIGNRELSQAGDEKPARLDYTSNWLNQYVQTHADGALLSFNQSYDVDGNLTGEWLAADCNCDTYITVTDIGAFVLALTSPEDYEATYPNCELATADLNGDGLPTVGDVPLFQSTSWGSLQRGFKMSGAASSAF